MALCERDDHGVAFCQRWEGYGRRHLIWHLHSLNRGEQIYRLLTRSGANPDERWWAALPRPDGEAGDAADLELAQERLLVLLPAFAAPGLPPERPREILRQAFAFALLRNPVRSTSTRAGLMARLELALRERGETQAPDAQAWQLLPAVLRRAADPEAGPAAEAVADFAGLVHRAAGDDALRALLQESQRILG